ncbi:LOW QUALITY PROTEIN: uncharacterized protein [Amphiura filiformis]|uniref:LOW QUALITY PROTEIN: uncharacterized protein n=1 Tax=Amphiura filiformis TaxID=82378 RepID=UPI003B2286A9
MAGHVQRISRNEEHQTQTLGSKEAMTALINPSYDSNADSPTVDAVNANTTVSVSDIVTDVLGNQLKTMSMKLDGESNNTDSNLTVDNQQDNEVKRRNSSGSSSGSKSRTKYASTDLSAMGVGDPFESFSDDNSQPDSGEGRLTVADDNILRERNKKKAAEMFADIDFIDDGDDDIEESSDEEEEEDNSKDCEQEKDIKRVKGEDVHVIEYEEDDDEDDDDEDDEDSDEDDVSGTGSPKDPDADVVSPDDEVIAAKLGGFLSYYANLESLAKSRVDELDDDEASLNESVSDSDVSENHEGLYNHRSTPTPYDSGPSTMDEESTDCESTYDMLYKSFGLRTQEEVVSKDLISPMGGQPDHGYASETSTDDKTSPIKRPGLLVNESSKPSLSTLIEDSKASSPDSHCSKLSPTVEGAESGIEVTPEPKSNLEPILDKKNAISKPTSLPPGWREVADTPGTYYWHTSSGTTQWSPPSPSSDDCSSPPKKPARMSTIHCNAITNLPNIIRETHRHADVQADVKERCIPTDRERERRGREIDERKTERKGGKKERKGGKREIEKGRRREKRLDAQCSTSSDQTDSGRGSSSTEPDTSLQAFQQSTLRYANLKLVPDQSQDEEEPTVEEPDSPRGIRFHVRSLGWVEMEDSDLSPGKSSLAVNNCIRQLSYRKNDIRDTAGIWGEGKDMYMVLEDEYLKLTDPNDGTVLNSQHVCSIRVWGVGRDNGRDFAYVARDKVTKRYKCHVFRCDIPAKAIANALHEICAVMSERQKGHTISMVTQGQMIQQQQQQQLMQMRSISLDSNKAPTPTAAIDFPTPKAEPITVFRAHYVGNAYVPKHGGMETLNMAINKAFETIPEENWIPARIEVAVSTVTVTNIKTKEVIAENRIRFLSFLGIGPDIRQFGYIMCIGKNKFQSHVFCCEHSAGGLAKAIEAACKLRYQKCLDAKPKGHSYRSDHHANGKGWGGALKSGVSNLFSKFKAKEAPIAAV